MYIMKYFIIAVLDILILTSNSQSFAKYAFNCKLDAVTIDTTDLSTYEETNELIEKY